MRHHCINERCFCPFLSFVCASDRMIWNCIFDGLLRRFVKATNAFASHILRDYETTLLAEEKVGHDLQVRYCQGCFCMDVVDGAGPF